MILSCLPFLLVAGVASCSHPARQPAPPWAWGAASLPSLASLDKLRTASSSQVPVDVTLPVDEANTSAIGSNLGFAPPPGGIAFAVFRVLPPVETIVSVAAGGAHGLYLLVADYGAGHWTGAVAVSGGFAVASLSTLGNPLSPAGYVYCAVIAPPGVQGQLTSLALNYDGPSHIYYVAPPAKGGDDGNPGTSAAPWATLQHAADSIGPDTLVIVRAADYDGFTLGASGSFAQPIIFYAEPGVVLDGGYDEDTGICLSAPSLPEVSNVVIEGFTIHYYAEYGIYVEGKTDKAHDITLRNNTVSSCVNSGIMVQHTDNAVIDGNTVSDCWGEALQIVFDSDHVVVRHNLVFNNYGGGISFLNAPVAGGDNNLDDELITANICHDNYDGIWADGLTNSTISNNLLYANPQGLGFSNAYGYPCTGNLIANNTVLVGSTDETCVWLADGSTGNKVFNNILYGNPDFGSLYITSPSLTDFLSDNNILSDDIWLDGIHLTLAEWQAITLRDAHSLVSLPALTFVDPSAPDYHLLPSASAVNAALIDYMPSDDLDGVARPQGAAPDCGCYELVP